MARRKLKRPPMPGAGRPPIDDPRRFVVRFLVTESERARFLSAAEKQAQTFSDWVREACELACSRGSTR